MAPASPPRPFLLLRFLSPFIALCVYQGVSPRADPPELHYKTLCRDEMESSKSR